MRTSTEVHGAASAGLQFVGNRQDAMLVAQCAQALHQPGGDDVKAAFALHGLDDDGGQTGRLDLVLEDGFNRRHGVVDRYAAQGVGEDRVEHFAGKRSKTGLVGHDFAGQAHGQQRAAMEAAAKGDHARASGKGTGDFHGVSNGFGTRRQKHGFLGKAPGSRAFRRSASSTCDSYANT